MPASSTTHARYQGGGPHSPIHQAAAAFITRDPARLTALCALWRSSGREVWVTLQGSSMVPNIVPGSRLLLSCRPAPPEVGMAVAYRRGAELIVHRVVAVAADPSGKGFIVCRGDANGYNDSPVRMEDVVGIVVEIRPPTAWLMARLRARRMAIRTLPGPALRLLLAACRIGRRT